MKRPSDPGRVFATIRGGAVLEALLRLLLPRDLRDEFIGDLVEETRQRQRTGARAARWLWSEALWSVPSLLMMQVRRLAGFGPRPALAASALPLSQAEVGRGFAAFMQASRVRSGPRPLPIAITVVVHVALIVYGVGRSFWHVDEVDPPRVVITWRPHFTPPNPPPQGGQQRTEEARPETKPIRKNHTLLPVKSDKPVAAIQAETDTRTGTKPGDRPGADCPRGQICDGPEIVDPPRPSMLPPSVGEKSCLDCPLPSLPPAYRRFGAKQSMLIRICADRNGVVTKTQVLRGIDPGVDEGVARSLERWRYSPFMVNGNPVPFCYNANFLFTTE